jgi:Tetratricopeptide repeat
MWQVYSLIALAMVLAGCATRLGGSGSPGSTQATSSSTGVTSTTSCRADTPDLSFNFRMVDCENQWVALPKKPGEDSYGYGYVYLDPGAGFTLHWGGSFTLDAQEKYHKVPDRSDGKERRIIRLGGYGVAAPLPKVAPLSKEALTQLGLPERPDWMKYYEDRSDAVSRKVHRGRAYNLIGEPERALAYLEPAYKERADAQGLAFELAYAYNALKRYDQASTVLTSAVARNPKDPHLCRELAFTYLHTKKFKEAVEQYPYAFPSARVAIWRGRAKWHSISPGPITSFATRRIVSNGFRRPRSGRLRAHPSMAFSNSNRNPCKLALCRPFMHWGSGRFAFPGTAWSEEPRKVV